MVDLRHPWRPASQRWASVNSILSTLSINSRWTVALTFFHLTDAQQVEHPGFSEPDVKNLSPESYIRKWLVSCLNHVWWIVGFGPQVLDACLNSNGVFACGYMYIYIHALLGHYIIICFAAMSQKLDGMTVSLQHSCDRPNLSSPMLWRPAPTVSVERNKEKRSKFDCVRF